MSGYLHGLVARASGAPVADASARARRPPRFPIGGAAGGEPVASEVEGREGRPGRLLEPPATSRARDERRPEIAVGVPRVARAADTRATTPARVPAAPPTVVAPPLPATTIAPAPAPAAERSDDVAAPRVRVRLHDVLPDERRPEPAAERISTVRIRPAPAPATHTPPPRIEVHIGRVEVRRPAAPALPARSQGDAGPSRPAPRGFGELAAARRYVDRLAR